MDGLINVSSKELDADYLEKMDKTLQNVILTIKKA